MALSQNCVGIRQKFLWRSFRTVWHITFTADGQQQRMNASLINGVNSMHPRQYRRNRRPGEFLDQGSDQNLTPGDVFTVYRMNRAGMPPVPVGEVAVLSVRPQSAVARIIQSRLPIYVGDRLEKK